MFSVFWMIIGVAFYSMIIGIISAFFTNKDDMNSLVKKKHQTIEDFCDSFSLKPEIKETLKESITYASSKLSYQWLNQQEDIFGELSTQLQYDFLMALHQDLITKCPFFAGRDLSFVVRVVPLLKPAKVKSGEILWQPGDHSAGSRRGLSSSLRAQRHGHRVPLERD